MGLTDKIKRRTGKGPNKSVSIGDSRPSNGFGYITIPGDVDRDAYIRSVYETGLVMITTSQNQIIKNVAVPYHILKELRFPEKTEKTGQKIHWMNIPKSNQLVISGIHFQSDEFNSFNQENSFNESMTVNANTILVSKVFQDTLQYMVTLINRGSTGGRIALRAYSNAVKENTVSELILSADGTGSIYSAKRFQIKSDQSIAFSVGFKSSEKTSISISPTEFLFTDQYENIIKIIEKVIEIKVKENGTIKLGSDAQQKAVLGDKLQQELDKNKLRLDTLLQAIEAAPIVAQDGGASFKASLVAVIQTMTSEDYGAILSSEIILT